MSILDEVDRLYEVSVSDPGKVSDQLIADWSEAIASSADMDRRTAKFVRRCITAARKLAAFWIERESTDVERRDWATRVDLSLGPKAWRPELDLALHLLETTPSVEVYERTAELFRVVNREPFLDGVSYDEWLESRQM